MDRGAPALPVLQRMLAYFFERHEPADAAWLSAAAADVFGMVAADATDIQIAGYLKSIARTQGIPFPPKARLTSIALWHIAKAALVRDTATRLLNADLSAHVREAPSLDRWLASRLLTPEELAEFEREAPDLGDA
ncbi:MAG: hypothetical protein K1X31_10490 [Gemmatimonadaceae bacterium]|nr:hypothetical protein [Gemmatimonadaceae bacterium]